MPFDVAIEKLNAFKSRVLDLTRRNSLINSRFSSRGKKHFRIIDEIPQIVYEKLSESSMSFDHLPPLDTDPRDEQTDEFRDRLSIALLTDEQYLERTENASEDESRVFLRELKNRIREDLGMAPFQTENITLEEHARNVYINPSFDLQENSDGNARHIDNKLQTLFLEDELDSFLNKLSRDFKSSQKERGVNPLYFCFGFLKWKESEVAEEFSHAPLLMLQVQFDESAPGARIKVSSTGNDLILNQSIKEKIKQSGYGTNLPDLPELEEGQDYYNLSDYFQTVEDFAYEKGWALKRWVSFGIYDAQNMPVFRDLENIVENIDDKFDLLKRFLEGGTETENQNSSAEIYDVDSPECQNAITALVTDADSSQFSAVKDAVSGKDIVLKGPPGTGKSQTITNIISSLIANGKKVLFVAQKQAALDVVRNNLEAIGSEDYLLEIFSLKANKKAVMESIRSRKSKTQPTNPQGLNEKIERFNQVKKELNEYSYFINDKYGETDKTIHEILWDQASEENLDSNSFQLNQININSPNQISDTTLNSELEKLQIIIQMIDQNFQGININESPLRKVQRNNFSSDATEEFRSKLIDGMSKFETALQAIESFLDNKPVLSVVEMSNIFTNSIAKWKNSEDLHSSIRLIVSVLLNLENVEDLNKYLEDKIKEEKKRKDLRNEENYLVHIFNPDRLISDEEITDSFLDEIKSASKEFINQNFFSFLSREWWKARKLFLNLKNPSVMKLTGSEIGSFLIRLHDYLRDKPNKEKEIADLSRNATSNFYRFQKFANALTESDLRNEEDFIKNAVKDFKNFDRDFLDFWKNNPEIFSEYYDLLENLFTKHRSLLVTLNEFNVVGLLSPELQTVSEVRENTEQVNTLIDHLTFLNHFIVLTTQERMLSGNLKDFYEVYTKSGAPINDIKEAYKHHIRKAQKNDIQETYGDKLSLYSGYQIESLRNELRLLDKEVTELYRQRSVHNIHKSGRIVSPGNSRGRVKDKTDMGLINHLSSVTNPRMSLRDFINKTQGALPGLKPCSLMSPLTVSTTLPLEETFDVVIIDEASQMKPEYAIGAIARAKQAIIVGDPQQLPPTTFYQAALADDEFDDDLGDESILDMAMTIIHPPRQLLWHYRSRHEDLIKFSNTKFYNNELMVPVTANPAQENRGILYNFIEDGRYISGAGSGSGGINPNEAKAVVKAAIDLMKNRPDESLGIATMNIKQKEFIQNEFDLRSANDDSVREYLTYWQDQEEGLEEFFIKNLENVQGDERDVIMVSTVYGKEENQTNVNQRFGPINTKFGARRLNVLFTRAKNELQLFTSLKTADILIDENSSRGKEIFKDYLAYAETGILEDVEANSREVDSPFQQWAIDVINSFPGYEAFHEVGTRGYFIDIGVKHEDYPFGYMMAVETDGATYHSQKSARDRDKLRQDILEGHGWVFHRIWSTDWLIDPKSVKDRLKDALDNRLQTLLEVLNEG